MRYWGILIVGVLLLSVVSCAGSSESLPERQVSLTPVESLPLDGISVSQSGDQVVVTFAQLAEAGRFASLVVPEGYSLDEVTWLDDEHTLHLAVPVATGADFGIVPLPGYAGAEVTASARLVAGVKQVSQPPYGKFSLAEDFTISYLDEMHIVAEWTEANIGDYDLNGIVTVSDLTPLGQNFGAMYDVNATSAQLNPLYWVDGNRDGRISVYDITPIGQNYGSSISGYVLYAEYEVVHDPKGLFPTCRRNDTDRVTFRDGLPPYYRIELPGFVDQVWELAPTDIDGMMGEDPESNRTLGNTPNITVDIELDGIPLFDQSYTPQEEPDNPFEILRIIDDTDIVDSMEIDERLALGEVGDVYFTDGGRARIVNLPEGETVLLEAVYAPAVDLATGAAKSAAELAPADLQFTVIPFKVPSIDNPLHIDLAINMVENPAGGYFANLDVVSTRGTIVVENSTRVDFRTGTVSRLNRLLGDFESEAALGDMDGDGISAARLEQELDEDLYKVAWTLGRKFVGKISTFDEAGGGLMLTDAAEVTTGGETPIEGGLLVNFSELTIFGEIVVGGDYNNSNALDPSSLAVGDDLVLGVNVFNNDEEGLPTKYWANVIVRQLPES